MTPISNHDIVQRPADRFLLGHYAFGVIFGLAKLPWWAVLGISVAWELGEDWLKDQRPELFPRPIDDTRLNSMLDTAAMMAGWATIKALPPDPLTTYFSELRAEGVQDLRGAYNAELKRRGL
jgi:hypothetical protein